MTSFPTNHRDFYQIKMADKPDKFLKDLISSAIKEVESKSKSFESTEITKESFLASLPDDSFYYLKAISGNGEKFKVHFLTEDITKENLEQWISEYEVINSISVKLKGNSGIKTNLFRIVVLYLNFQFLINFLTVLLPLSKSFT